MCIRPPNDPLGSMFCSKACQLSCTSQSHNLLFGNAALLPSDATTKTPIPDDVAKRRDVQIYFAEYIKDSGKLSPLFVARCVARMISNEIVKIAPGSPVSPPPPSDLPEADTASSAASSGAEYTFYDHMDRLRFLEVPPMPAEDTEIELLRNVLNSTIAGLDDFIQDERSRVLKGKILYNSISVSFGGGHLDEVLNSSNSLTLSVIYFGSVRSRN
jgi:mitochondrial import receptor subunit TOM20